MNADKSSWRGHLALACRGHPARATFSDSLSPQPREWQDERSQRKRKIRTNADRQRDWTGL